MKTKQKSNLLPLLSKAYTGVNKVYNPSKEASWIGAIHSEVFIYSKLKKTFEKEGYLIRIGNSNKDEIKSKGGADIVIIKGKANNKCCLIEVKFSAWKEINGVKMWGWGWSFGKTQDPHFAVLIAGDKKNIMKKIFIINRKDVKKLRLRHGMQDKKGVSTARYILYTNKKNKQEFLKAVKKKLHYIQPIEKTLEGKLSSPSLKRLIKGIKRFDY